MENKDENMNLIIPLIAFERMQYKEEKITMLRDMMQEASSDDERRALQKIIRRMENG